MSPSSAQSPEPTSADDPTREQFKAALEAKKAKSGHSSGKHAEGAHGPHTHASREGGKREFRRKSGG
jgi:hypothetical protein